MTDDEDFLLAIQEIRFFPENIMMVEFVDGSIVEMEINPCWPNSERKRWK